VARAESLVETEAAPEQPASREAPDGPLRLQIESDEEVWVQITAGGERVFQGLLQQSETKQLTGLEEARVLVGNAGGLRIYWNGKPIGPIGERGEVRVVRLTPEGPRVSDPRRATPTPADENGSSSRS
jgi:hypothetical protein